MNDQDENKAVRKEDLHFEFHEDPQKEGLFAAFDSEGRLAELKYSDPDQGGATIRLTVKYASGEACLTKESRYPDRPALAEGPPLSSFVQYGIDTVYRAQPSARRFCSFCQKHSTEVKTLIAGPTIYICDECVSLCNDILAEIKGEHENR
jgi:hypothetical protein